MYKLKIKTKEINLLNHQTAFSKFKKPLNMNYFSKKYVSLILWIADDLQFFKEICIVFK